MIHAYAEEILENAMDVLGTALDYAVRLQKINGQEFLDFFLISGIAKEFESGNPRYISGMSGRDMADEVLSACGKQSEKIFGEYNGDYTPEYWCGWILAYFQWETGLSFKKIMSVLSFEQIINSYGVLHEADVSKSVEVFNGLIRSESFLARMRKKRGLTQAALAEKSHVSLRSIQLYEQKKNDIGKAQYNNLKDIAEALQCDIEDILE